MGFPLPKHETVHEIGFIMDLWKQNKLDTLRKLRQAYHLRGTWDAGVDVSKVMQTLDGILGKEDGKCEK